MDGVVGMIKMVLAPLPHNQWLPCDGRAISSEEHPQLFEMLGYAFGGSFENFCLPNIPKPEHGFFVMKVQHDAEDKDYRGFVAQVVMWAGDKPPRGWLPCDGRLVRGADYPLLQKVAAQGPQGITVAEFHLPQIPAMPGLMYIICVDGLDPAGMPSDGPVVVRDDDDY